MTQRIQLSTLYDKPALTGKKILVIVENLPVPFDRRVWQEALALAAAGAEVLVICPISANMQARSFMSRCSRGGSISAAGSTRFTDAIRRT